MAVADSQCAHCGKKGDLKRCSICKVAWYCNAKCQKEDIKRHRKEDRCGAVSTPSTKRMAAVCPAVPSDAPSVATSKVVAGRSPATSSTSPASKSSSAVTPAKRGLQRDDDLVARCQRCRGPAGKAHEQYFAEVVRKSIYAPDCVHGPVCGRCADKLQRQTLAFCNCRALVQRYVLASCRNGVDATPVVAEDDASLLEDSSAAQDDQVCDLPGCVNEDSGICEVVATKAGAAAALSTSRESPDDSSRLTGLD